MTESRLVIPFVMWAAVVGSVLAPARADAAGTLRLDRVDKTPTIDGAPSPNEWAQMQKLGAVKGSPSAADFSGKGAVTYDDKSIFIAVDVTDDALVGGGSGDRIDLVIAVGSSAQTVSIFPGQPGKSAGKATAKGSSLSGAKVVEAPKKGGWTLEASIPWSAFDGTSTTRVGLKGGLFVHDVDSGTTVDATIGTASGTDTSSLNTILTTPEQALADGLMKDKKLGAPSFVTTANVVGDAMKERVMVFGNFLVVLGPTFRGGKEFYWNDMSVAGSSLALQSFETRDLDGDGREDIVFKKRFTKSGQKTSRDVLQVLSFGTAEVPDMVFRHEVGISNAKGSVTNEVSFGSDGGKPTIVIKPGSAKGLDQGGYDEPTESSFDPLLLPWGTIDEQVYKAKGKSFARASEKTHAKAAPPPAPKPAETKPTPAAQAPAKPDTAKVYALYKKDRKITSAARFDLSGDVAEDSQVERVVVHDKEIAVFGPGFKSGSSYVFTNLAFAESSDIKSVTLRDVTADKKADLVVRGILKAKGPKKEDVEREVEMVFRVTSDGLRRIFAAEVGRSIGSNKIIGSISYESGKVTLASGKAVGFTKDTYPFGEDKGTVGGFEPLLLPWGDTKSLKYKWSGSAFDKQ